MRHERTVRSRLLIATMSLLAFGVPALAQNPTPQPSPSDQAQTQNQNQTTQDVFGQLNLTPDQVQKIRSINAELKEQRQAANQRLRLAQRSLTEAIESPTPNESLIEQRSREVADAQSSVIRLRSLTEARVLQVMTAEQRVRLREIRARNQALRREAAQQGPGNGLRQRQQGLQRGQARPGPGQRRLMRQPQKPQTAP
jgi:Spy/CpxP family protein refolding chaperone